ALVRYWAGGRGYATRGDAAGNLVVAVPATAGRAGAPTVVLQAHLDMVCEKRPDVAFDFATDAIRTRVDGGWVRADGTTLGADNGIGVAALLAVADDPEVAHGPLELLLTVEEEIGLTGALALDAGLVTGRLLLNLDSEDDSAFTIGCAGAADTVACFAIERRAATPATLPFSLAVRGLPGGHSGTAILANPPNPLKVLAGHLAALLHGGVELDLVRLDGGKSRNAIPRDATAVLRLPAAQVAAAQAIVAARWEALAPALAEAAAAGARCDWEAGEESGAVEVMDAHDRDRLLDALLACPHGVAAMSRTVPGLVETSNNLARVETAGREVSVAALSRSLAQPALAEMAEQVAAGFRLAGAEIATAGGYPGWRPDLASPLLAAGRRAFGRLFGREPVLRAVHAGLECGILGAKIPGLAMLSFGPRIEGAHTPDERVEIASVASFYRLLAALLDDLAPAA
ncbi:MAG TPA: beta-Ala-His dipeptidase, partial [Thermoanaerobaculia bacterium]